MKAAVKLWVTWFFALFIVHGVLTVVVLSSGPHPTWPVELAAHYLVPGARMCAYIFAGMSPPTLFTLTVVWLGPALVYSVLFATCLTFMSVGSNHLLRPSQPQ